MPETFTFFDKFGVSLECFEKEEQMQLAYAAVMYGLYGKEEELPRHLKAAFVLMMEDIDNSKHARKYGSKGGKKKKTTPLNENEQGGVSESAKAPLDEKCQAKPNQTNTNQTNTDHTKEVEGSKRKRFSPPTPDDVKAYCKEKGYDDVDPDRFVDFYASKGWVVGKSPMKNWKAAVSNWHRRELDESAPKQEVCTDYDD